MRPCEWAKTALANEWRASPLFSPAWHSLRRSAFSIQSSMKSVRSIRPISPRARYNRFCWRYAPSLRRISDGLRDLSRMLAASRMISPQCCRITSSLIGLPMRGDRVGHAFGLPKHASRRSGKSRKRGAKVIPKRWNRAKTWSDTPPVSV